MNAPATNEFMKHADSGAESPKPQRRFVHLHAEGGSGVSCGSWVVRLPCSMRRRSWHMIWSVNERALPQPTQSSGTTGTSGRIVRASAMRR